MPQTSSTSWIFILFLSLFLFFLCFMSIHFFYSSFNFIRKNVYPLSNFYFFI